MKFPFTEKLYESAVLQSLGETRDQLRAGFAPAVGHMDLVFREVIFWKKTTTKWVVCEALRVAEYHRKCIQRKKEIEKGAEQKGSREKKKI